MMVPDPQDNEQIHRLFLRGVDLFNSGEFFEAHEEMEQAMNLLVDDTGDWEFFLGILRAAVANHKLMQGEEQSAILHLRAALKFLASYGDRHAGIKLREFRNALTVQLDRLVSRSSDTNLPLPTRPRIEIVEPPGLSPAR